MIDHPTPLRGTCSTRFDSLRELFASKLESGEDLGASLAVDIDGEMVVDLWGGWADEARAVPWEISARHGIQGRHVVWDVCQVHYIPQSSQIMCVASFSLVRGFF